MLIVSHLSACECRYNCKLLCTEIRKFAYQIGYHYQHIFVIEYWLSLVLVKFHIHATLFSSTVHGIYSSMTTVTGATYTACQQ